MKCCVFSAPDADNTDPNSNNIIFPIKSTKLYVSVVTLSAKDNQKLSKSLSKGSERSVYWTEYKIKSENKNTIGKYRCFLELNFVGVNRVFKLNYSNQGDNTKRHKTRRYYLPKGIKNCNINKKNFCHQPIDYDVKGYKEIRKLTTVPGEDYT